MDPTVIDLDDVMERVQDDKELLLELFDIFEEDYARRRKVLEDALAAKNFETIRDVIHSIKGAAGNIGAKTLHATCQNIEHMAMDENLNGIVQVMPALDEQYDAVQGHIAQLRVQFGKG